MAHDLDQQCRCVTVHVPKPNELHSHHVWPLSEGGPAGGERLWLCPTMHTNVHELWRAYTRHNGHVPWSIAQHYSPYCRAVVAKGWALATANDGT